jgi:hypothetical protein
MYIFSVTATAMRDTDDAKSGESRPFIIYINFQELFGAQSLVRAYLIRAGYSQVNFEDQKHLSNEQLGDHAKVAGNPMIVTALRDGYAVQLFEA